MLGNPLPVGPAQQTTEITENIRVVHNKVYVMHIFSRKVFPEMLYAKNIQRNGSLWKHSIGDMESGSLFTDSWSFFAYSWVYLLVVHVGAQAHFPTLSTSFNCHRQTFIVSTTSTPFARPWKKLNSKVDASNCKQKTCIHRRRDQGSWLVALTQLLCSVLFLLLLCFSFALNINSFCVFWFCFS